MRRRRATVISRTGAKRALQTVLEDIEAALGEIDIYGVVLSSEKFKNRVEAYLREELPKWASVGFNRAFRTYASLAINPKARQNLLGAARQEGLEPDDTPYVALETLIEALDRARLRPETQRVVMWYRARGFKSYRSYAKARPVRRLRIGPQKWSKRLEDAGKALEKEFASRKRGFNYESGKFARYVETNLKASITRLDVQLGKLGKASRVYMREMLFDAAAKPTKVHKRTRFETTRSAMRQAFRDIVEQYPVRVNYSWEVRLRSRKERAIASNYFRAGLTGNRHPLWNSGIATLALLRAIRQRRSAII